jgi:hypothetical protein
MDAGDAGDGAPSDGATDGHAGDASEGGEDAGDGAALGD